MKFLHRNWRQLFMFYRLIAFTERLPEIEFDNLDTYSDYMPRNQISLPARRKAFAEACFSESRRFKEFVSFSEAKTLLKPHKIPTRAQYLELRKSIDNRLPSKPDVVYLEWAGWPDFLQVADEKARRNKEKYLSFDECKARIAELKKVLPLNTLRDYQKFCQSHKGQGFNSNPNIYYRAVWKGWNDFLGTEKRVPIHERKTFDETKQIARLAYLQNGVDNRDKWIKYVDGLERSADYDDPPWARRPDVAYADQWNGWDDFFGIEKKESREVTADDILVRGPQKRRFQSFEAARIFARTLHKDGLVSSAITWQNHIALHRLREFPSCPNITYSRFWQGWSDFLGKSEADTHTDELRSRKKRRTPGFHDRPPK